MGDYAGEIGINLKKEFSDIDFRRIKYNADSKKKIKEDIISLVIYILVIAVILFKFWKQYAIFLGDTFCNIITSYRIIVIIALLILRVILINMLGVNQEGAFEVKYNNTLIFSGLKEKSMPSYELINKKINEIRNKDK